ncbi:MAG: CCA tRNA nucleotidyltransferase [Clostridia bacterium]|nr:CCA tRNA nucleotidyltransferase [Clostridia bacterium]
MWKLPAGAEFVINRLNQQGFAAYVVGGCVRDTLLGKAPKDWDVCTNALPEQMQQVFADCHVIETGLQHGTLTVMYDHEPFEVTTFRVDGEYTDHRHPDEVVFVSDVRDDLSRRDFTVNAMAWSPETGLVDAFGGREDLQKQLIRCVGEPERRFDEDALRIMRALRFASVYGFAIDPATDAAIHALKHTLTDVAAERIRVELAKLLCGQGAGEILRAYRDVLAVIMPPLSMVDWPSTVSAVEKAPPTEVLRLTMLLHQLKPADAKAVLMSLKLDNFTRDRALLLILNQNAELLPTRHSLLTALSLFGEEVVRQLLMIREAKGGEVSHLAAVLDEVLSDGVCYTVKDMAVNGRDLMTLGAKGKQVGDCLAHLLSILLAETLPNDRDALLAAAKKHLNQA